MMMRHPISRLLYLASLSMCLMVVPLHAQTRQNLQTIMNISAVPGLKVQRPIAMPTAFRQGREAMAPGAKSPFSSVATQHDSAPPTNLLRFPADLEFHGGPTVQSAEQSAIFINPTAQCPPNSCFGDPVGFLQSLSGSRFIAITNQYVNASGQERYPVGINYMVPGYSPSAGAGKPFTNFDMAIAAYSIAAQTGSFGYGHIYHLFLPPGQDVCFDNTFSVCYSPDNLNTWSFCAYHGSVTDGAGNVVLYTVEPYQNVSGCNVRPGTPNGQLMDSTNSTLSHETFETITDPQANAWWNSLDDGIYGEEIGDECAFLLFTPNNVYFDPSIVSLNGKPYAVQPEYSNGMHACTTLRAH